MIQYSKKAFKKLEFLIYYPITFGHHIDKVSNDLKTIFNIENSLTFTPTLRVVSIPNIGNLLYISNDSDNIIIDYEWRMDLMKFYYTKSNFIHYVQSRGNIPSVHPQLYKECNEPFFNCENGYKVVKRKVNNKTIFNFIDNENRIISDIDFIQVKPFCQDSEVRDDMTARGYTPDRRCYIVFEDGYRTEVNESHKRRFTHQLNESEEIPNRFRHLDFGFYISSDKIGNYTTSLFLNSIRPKLLKMPIAHANAIQHSDIRWRPFKVIY